MLQHFFYNEEYARRLPGVMQGANILPVGSESAPERKEEPSAKEKLAGLRNTLDGNVRGTLDNVLGEDSADILSSPDRRVESIQKVAQLLGSLGVNWDRLCAIFAPLKISGDEIEATLREPEEDTPENEAKLHEATRTALQYPEPPDILTLKDYKGPINRGVIRMYERAKARGWLKYVKEAEAKTGVKAASIFTIMMKEVGEMMDPRKVNPKSGALGLAQAMPKTIVGYARDTGRTHVDVTEPREGIMLIAWHARNAMRSVDKAISEGRLAAKYRIGPDDVERLYLTHNSGVGGYVAYCRYLEDPSKKNYDALYGFQRKKYPPTALGSIGYERRANYAKQAGQLGMQFRKFLADKEAPPDVS
ncbi:hypothetical protein CO046_01575 [Candidatus Peregrinibacteria bacterium CG_4_9_14_0_2_um_filter_53_11]|nr:MAG: hypothetical protein CO046_01575 [Candidatus Peregrinibacteria bacterium CG_4_9_14_0_2_um_filter_53_11]